MSNKNQNTDKETRDELIPESPNVPSDEQVFEEPEVAPNPNDEEVKQDDNSNVNPVAIEMVFEEPEVAPNPNDVLFKFSYKENYRGKKRHAEGSTEVISKETAKHFEKLGIGKIIKQKK